MIVETAAQEDVDAIGLSILSGAHLELFPPIIDGFKKKGMTRALVIAGGIIPDEDIKALQEIGVKAVFGPGTPTSDIADFLKTELTAKLGKADI